MKNNIEMQPLSIKGLYPRHPTVFDEMQRLQLARQVLCGLFTVSVGVLVAHAYWDNNEPLAKAFELMKIGVFPLVTLVVSFYFPHASATKD